MLDRVDSLAKSYTPVEGVCIRLLPYRPMFWNAHQERLKVYAKECGEAWTAFHNIFILTCPVMTGLHVSEDAPLWAQALALWYEARTGDIVQDWQLFQQVAPEELAGVLWEAYQATRLEAELPRAPEVLQQPAPVPVDEDGQTARPIKAGGKRFRKH